MVRTDWRYNPHTKALYYIENGKRYLVLGFGIYPNGVRDSCLAKGDGGTIIAKIADTPKENIIYIPEGDIAVVELEGWHDRYLIFPIDESMRPFLNLVTTEYKHAIISTDYDMYAGTFYSSEQREAHRG